MKRHGGSSVSCDNAVALLGGMATAETTAQSALHVINEQLQEAIDAPKCHRCGCLQQTVEALAQTETGKGELAAMLTQARSVFVLKKYDCLGCAVCYPAIAANAFIEAYPQDGGGFDLCPTEEPEERNGWPPLPGAYFVIRYGAPVAVCALNSETLAKSLAERKPEGLAIIGTMHTENLGIERVIKNTLANSHIRFLLLCGQDTQQALGHLPGQSFENLFRNGLDEQGRIIGARGKRPVLKNISREEVQAFMQQVELVSMIGEEDPANVSDQVRSCAKRSPGAYPFPFKDTPIKRIQVPEPKRLTLDKAGYFVVYPDTRNKRLVVEHYTNHGVLNCVLEGNSTGVLYCEAIERQLLTRLDHAAYLGRELARAEQSLLTGVPFVQDAAPGELAASTPEDTDSGCGCSSAAQTKGCC
jgi:tetrahydromethanopterin S-methyltransferase subunit A